MENARFFTYLCVNIHILTQLLDDIIEVGEVIMTLSKAVANRVDFYLFSRGITLYQLAKDAGLPVATLQNLYRGNTKTPTLALIYKISIGLGISITEFLEDEFFSIAQIELD